LRRIKMIMGMAAVLVGMLALNAGPAMADELDGVFIEEDHSGDGVLVVDEGTTTLDELCSPGLSDGIFIPGCIFSDPIEEDDADAEEVIFFVEDIDFDFNDDFSNDDFDEIDFDDGDNDFDDNDSDRNNNNNANNAANNNGGNGGRN
jgi:hypothetical protein